MNSLVNIDMEILKRKSVHKINWNKISGDSNAINVYKLV
jgi:hypothetical protein